MSKSKHSAKIHKLKLGAFDYDLVYRLASDDDCGSTCLIDKTIWINTRYSTQVQKETLLHELLHVALEDCPMMEFPIEKKGDMEEAVVRFTSPRLFQFFKDNRVLLTLVWGIK